MSIPADTPDEVTNLPSSTQRASFTHSTFGPWAPTQPKAVLLVVARRPSSIPARASSAVPVHTVMAISASPTRCAANRA